MRTPIRTVCLFTLLALASHSWLLARGPQNGSLSGNTPNESTGLLRQFAAFAGDPSLKHANWSVYVTDIKNNTVILSHEPQRSLSPASVHKLITTASALILLGPEFRYHTALQYSGHIDGQGVLHGNVYIKGSGDPSLGATAMDDTLSADRFFGYMAKLLSRMGVTRITGNIIGDESIFDQEMVPGKWLWEDIGNYFGAGSSGLSFNENEYTVYFDAGRALEEPARVVGTKPAVDNMVLVNQVKTGPRGSGDRVYIFGAPYRQERWLTGTVPLGAGNFGVRGSMPDPAVHTAASFLTFLLQQGVKVDGQAFSLRTLPVNAGSNNRDRLTAGVWGSPPLKDIVRRTNIESANMYAENLLKTIGYETRGEGSTKAGAEAIAALWRDRGLDITGMQLHDGSGLSPMNRVTAQQMGFILNSIAKDAIFEEFLSSLPVAGESGTMKNMLLNTRSQGVMRVKSGTLGNVRAYAGYTTLKDNRQVSFVVIVNDFTGTQTNIRNNIMRLLDAITNY